jgi:hypothetical protein
MPFALPIEGMDALTRHVGCTTEWIRPTKRRWLLALSVAARCVARTDHAPSVNAPGKKAIKNDAEFR